jgi:hypothetical protein
MLMVFCRVFSSSYCDSKKFQIGSSLPEWKIARLEFVERIRNGLLVGRPLTLWQKK